MSESPAPSLDKDLYSASPPPSGQRYRQKLNHNPTEDSPSPPTSVSSDKENHLSRAHQSKGKGRAPMGPRVPSPDRNKRKRPTEREPSLDRTRRRRTVEVDVEDGSELEYDPDQDIEVRRQLRRDMRGLQKELTDGRAELLDPNNNTGLADIIERANNFAGQVKQTSDATIDSRLLVQAAEFSYKRTLALVSGDTAQGIDVDDYISKVKTYMRGNAIFEHDGEALSGTQRRRRANDVEDEEDVDGDMLDWEYLGRNACIKYTLRPSLPGFLLGPLSVEKRAKRAVTRKAAFRPNSIKETRPEVVELDQIEKRENANLAGLCVQIAERLETVVDEAMEAVDAQVSDDTPQAEADAVLDRYGISRDCGFALFKFVINPNSFGQTVENLFYTSFLIKDGKFGISMDDRGLPYLG
jgi:hypothetical protein